MEANRLQILFDEIPDEETRSAGKLAAPQTRTEGQLAPLRLWSLVHWARRRA